MVVVVKGRKDLALLCFLSLARVGPVSLWRGGGPPPSWPSQCGLCWHQVMVQHEEGPEDPPL